MRLGVDLNYDSSASSDVILPDNSRASLHNAEYEKFFKRRFSAAKALPIDEGFSHSHTLPDFPSPSITKVTLEISFSRTFCRNSITNREHAY